MELISYINLISIILLGMASGSFITMASYRLSVENQKTVDLLLKPSSCPKCHHRLGVANLIPIFSWILQKGRCSFCHSKISIRYPLIEMISTIAFVAIYFALNQEISAQMVIILLIFVTVLIMIITDLENYFISDINQIILFVLAIFYHFFVTFKVYPVVHSLSYYFLSSLFYLLFGLILRYLFKVFTKRDGLGIDDIKFFAVAGFMIGIKQFAFFMFLSGAIGLIFGYIWQKVQKDNTFPFAPALILALITSLLINFQ